MTFKMIDDRTVGAQRVAKKEGGIVSVIADCPKCRWRSESHITGQQDARDHNAKTGHVVTVEVVSVYKLT